MKAVPTQVIKREILAISKMEEQVDGIPNQFEVVLKVDETVLIRILINVDTEEDARILVTTLPDSHFVMMMRVQSERIILH